MDSISEAEEAARPVADASKRFLHRLLVVGENRFQLLAIEASEERDRVVRAATMVLVAVLFGGLGGVAVTVMVALIFWNHDPVLALGVLAVVYFLIVALACAGLVRLSRNWHTFSATIDQLKKDRECLKKQLA